jgi:hypothetical protein
MNLVEARGVLRTKLYSNVLSIESSFVKASVSWINGQFFLCLGWNLQDQRTFGMN